MLCHAEHLDTFVSALDAWPGILDEQKVSANSSLVWHIGLMWFTGCMTGSEEIDRFNSACVCDCTIHHASVGTCFLGS